MRIAVLLNPSSGRAYTRTMADWIGRVFRGSDIQWFRDPAALESHVRNHAGELPEFRSEAGPDQGFTLLLTVGGDGTVHHLVNRVAGLRIPLGVIPCGRANDFARALNMPLDPWKACLTLRSVRLTAVDLVSVNGRFLLTCGGLGLVTRAARRADRWREGRRRPLARALGPLCYPGAALLEILAGQKPMALTTRPHDVRRLSSLVVSNQPRFGGRFSVSPWASNTDGEVDLCEIPAAGSRWEDVKVCLDAWRGKGVDGPGVRHLRGSRFVVRTARPCVFTGDGEPMSWGREFVIEVHPRQLLVAVPDSSPAAEGEASWKIA